ncbi:MAG: tetratricopeptide repeat protein [Nitrospirota bacterium]
MRTAIQMLTVAGVMAIGSLPAWAQESLPESPPPALEQTDTATDAPTTDQPPADQSATAPADSPSPAPEGGPPTQAAGAEFQAGLSAYQKQDFAAAAENFESVVRTDPESADAYFYLGYSLYKLKRFDESRLAFAQAYELQTDYRPPLSRQ